MSSHWLVRQGSILVAIVLISGCARGTETHRQTVVGVGNQWSMSVARKNYIELQQELTCAAQLFVKKLNWATNMDNETLIAGRERSLVDQSSQLVRVRRAVAIRFRQGQWPTSLESNIDAELDEMDTENRALSNFRLARDRAELMAMVSGFLYRDSPAWDTLADTRKRLKITTDEAYSCPSIPGLIESNSKAREKLGEFPLDEDGYQKALAALRAAGGDVYPGRDVYQS